MENLYKKFAKFAGIMYNIYKEKSGRLAGMVSLQNNR